ncbi:hypothetical protein M6B38_229315 [Iris pallida]|uniref:Uncharacterized protein n=1 Tax=Iris pallida TaxID=29817 RepID=A0AAX6DTC5_IRIPA|nr:hypothetical protein M6B38_229315 [Iris pallida]
MEAKEIFFPKSPALIFVFPLLPFLRFHFPSLELPPALFSSLPAAKLY